MKRKTAFYWLMLLPALLLLCLLLAGFGLGLVQSFGWVPAAGLRSWTLDYYEKVLFSRDFCVSLLYSLWLAGASSAVSVLLGVALSWALLCCGGRGKALLCVPVVVPHTVVAFLGMALLAQNGFFSRLGFQLGLIENSQDFPLLVQDPAGLGIIVALVWKQAPFVLSVVALVMTRIQGRYLEAAQNMGAGPRQTFFLVVLPLSLPSAASAFLLIFAYAFGAYELPYLLGATLPKALPVQAYFAFTHPSLAHRPYAMVYSCLMLLFGFGLVALYLLALKKASLYEQEVLL